MARFTDEEAEIIIREIARNVVDSFMEEIERREAHTSTERTVSIYALCDPDGSVRYIGKSHDPEERIVQHLAQHLYPSRHDPYNPKILWLQELRLSGLEPVIKILEEDIPQHRSAEREKHWIDWHLAQGCDLTNKKAP